VYYSSLAYLWSDNCGIWHQRIIELDELYNDNSDADFDVDSEPSTSASDRAPEELIASFKRVRIIESSRTVELIRSCRKFRLELLGGCFEDEKANYSSLELPEIEDDDLDEREHTSKYIAFLKLLSYPGSPQTLRSRSFLNPGDSNDIVDSPSNSNLVNQWLLHNLRSSQMELDLLAMTHKNFDETVQKLGEEWQTDVLSHWNRDATNHASPTIERFAAPGCYSCEVTTVVPGVEFYP